MPSNPKQQWISHTFGGGWATDLGPMVRTSGDPLVIPFLVDARNCIYELDGGVRKMPGTAKLNSTTLETGSPILGLYDYWRQGVTGSPEQRRVVHVNGKVYADRGDGSFNEIASGLSPNAVPHYSTFDDLLLIGSDQTSDVPKSWDGTTFQNLAGTPPRFSFSVPHKNRQWAAGDFAHPSRLYYSVNLNPEDWVGATSGSIDIDPDDGDMITGLASFKNELIVFKGPHKGSIHRISGDSTSTFSRTPFIYGIGAAWQHTIFPLPNDLGFVSPRGTVHSLVAVQQFGDYERSTLSFPLNRWLQQNLNFNRSRFWKAHTDLDSGYTLIALTPAGQFTNSLILMMDFRFMQMGEPFPRWAYWDALSLASLYPTVDVSNRVRFFGGGYDGYVYRLDQADRTHNNTALNMRVETPFFTYGADHIEKSLVVVGIDLAPKNNKIMVVGWVRDNVSEQTMDLNQGGSDVLGPADDPVFTLDTSTLGGSRFVQRYIETEEGGSFRSIRYRFSETNNKSDIAIHGFVAAIEGDGVSTENN